IAELLMAKGYKHYMVEIGGEMRVSGLNPQKVKWRIAIEKPDTETRSIHRVIKVSDVAIATSGDYRNYFEQDGVKFSHTINPKTGYPVQQELASVTVLAKNSMTADAWATAFMVLGYKKGYDLAIDKNLAVLFLLKEGEGFKEISTPYFKRLTKEHAP
ncbi:MAG: FAD:protein FMN transferase, partial [Cycloclasticus sp.]